MDVEDLYAVLGVSKAASPAEIKRAFRTLRTKAHPDKGGDAAEFTRLVTAHNVLSDPAKRKHYDATGVVWKSPGEEFVEAFAGGSFADRASRQTAAASALAASVADQIAVRQSETRTHSHTAGFEAWMRSRGPTGTTLFTADTVAEQFGVVKSSYEGVPLPPRTVLSAVCRGPGQPQENVQLEAKPLPTELEWGQVYVELQLAPVTPADLYTIRLGGVYDDQVADQPFVPGHEGVGVVARVGPGVKDVSEGDVVLPTTPLLGTFRQAAVFKAKQLVRVGKLAVRKDGSVATAGSSTPAPEAALAPDELPMPLEYLAIHKELLLAYKLLEANNSLKPGDCVIINAANSIVGRTVLQLCKLLKLRCVALLRCRGSSGTAPGTDGDGAQARFEGMAEQLKTLGATLVLKDEGSIKAQLQAERFFGKPKLALDAVGGESAVRMAEVLDQEGRLIVYGCLGGKAATWPWQAWVFRGLNVSGFNIRKAIAADTPKGADILRSLLESVGKLVSAGLLVHEFTEYDFIDEWQEAVDHAMDAPGCSRVLLRMSA